MVRNALSDAINLNDSRSIKIVKYPHDIEASWSAVRAIIPQLLSNKRKVYQPDCEALDAELQIDILVQLGMRRSEDCIVFETIARRDGYIQRDVDDKELPLGDTEPGGIWEGLPEELSTSFDVDAAAQTVTKSYPVSSPDSPSIASSKILQDIPTRVSQDAHSFLCEFQFYSALAEMYKKQLPARVVFVHIPPSTAEKDIQDCAVVVEAYIKALVEQSGF